MQDKKKLNEIATPFQWHYLQFCFLLSVNQKGVSKKIFKRVWQVVETIFLPQKSFFLLKLAKISNFSFFSRILLVQVEENYMENNDLQYFLFQIKIANAILHADEVLEALYEISYISVYNALLHVTQIFFRSSNM